MGRSQLDRHGQECLVISRIFVETAWDLVQAKCSLSGGPRSMATWSGAAALATLREKRMKKEETYFTTTLKLDFAQINSG